MKDIMCDRRGCLYFDNGICINMTGQGYCIIYAKVKDDMKVRKSEFKRHI